MSRWPVISSKGAGGGRSCALSGPTAPSIKAVTVNIQRRILVFDLMRPFSQRDPTVNIRKEGHGRSARRLGCHKAPSAAINGLHANPSRVSELYEALIAAGAPRWQAIGLLHRFGGYQVGKTFLVDRLDLIRQLEEIAAGKQFEFETVRHERVVIQVDKTRKYRSAPSGSLWNGRAPASRRASRSRSGIGGEGAGDFSRRHRGRVLRLRGDGRP